MGAEELIELGRGNSLTGIVRTPFLANRRHHALGTSYPDARLGDLLDLVKDVGGMITGALGFALSTLGDLVSIPLDLLSQGIDFTFNGVAGLLDSIPIIGGLLSQILLLGGAVIKFALSVPGILLHGLGNIMTGISKALLQKQTPEQNKKSMEKAKQDIIGKAPPSLQSQVAQVLDSTGVSGTNLTPGLTPGVAAAEESGVSDALAIGLPVVGVVAAVLLLAT
jgi:hypothetical protein